MYIIECYTVDTEMKKHALKGELPGYIHNRCTKSSPTCFGTPWVPSTESLFTSQSSASEMVRSTQHSHTLAQVISFFSIKTQEKPLIKC
jgi:hypothetical protein